ncbi:MULTISPECIES: hypothetical protein [Streptomyces]|uniref:hypothetical protein n=1 Tax=Streptomyces TaxID=1883 RepID=UPI0031E015DC
MGAGGVGGACVGGCDGAGGLPGADDGPAPCPAGGFDGAPGLSGRPAGGDAPGAADGDAEADASGCAPFADGLPLAPPFTDLPSTRPPGRVPGMRMPPSVR